MSKQNSIDRLQTLLGNVAIVDENALQADIDTVSDLIDAGKTAAQQSAKIVELEMAVSDLNTQLAEAGGDSEAVENLTKANEAKDKQIAELEADITHLNQQLAAAEAKKVSALPTVEHEGATYQVKFGASVIHDGVMYKFTRDQIVANAKIGDTNLTPVAVLLAAESGAIKKV